MDSLLQRDESRADSSVLPVTQHTPYVVPRPAKPTPRPGHKTDPNVALPPNGYLKDLIESYLVSPDSWSALPREQQTILGELQPDRLLDALVDRGLLSTYQADRIKSGHTHGLVIGNYRVLNRIGAGGMGIVLKAEQIKLQRPVAIKLLAYGYAAHARLLQRFWSESRAVAQLQHPNIVTAIDAGEMPGNTPDDPPVPYFVMEYLEGQDLEDRVIQEGPLPIGEACRLLSQIADALAEAHSNKLIHRDIKPSNIFINTRGNAKLLDFGLARQTERKHITDPGMLLGTVGYMAPEQARDARLVDERADLFSLGCTLYWSLTGRHPYDDDEPNRRPTAMRILRNEIPVELDDLVRRLMAEKVEDRPKDAMFVYRSLLPFIPGNERIANQAAVAIRATPTAPRKQRVLIVDDAPTVRFMCLQTLQRSGFECVEVSDAGSALDAIAREMFDLILLDLQLPDMPGSSVLQKLRETQDRETVKVVIMSGVRDASDLAPLRLAGADDSLVKPFTSAQLLTLVKANLTLKEKQDLTDKAQRGLANENTKLRQQMNAMQTELTRTRDFLMQTVSELIGERNYISATRALRLQRYCKYLTQEAAKLPAFKDEINPEFVSMMENWVPLMDVGHLLLPDYLLLKPGDLSSDERELMQAHSTLGAELLSRIASKQPGQAAFFQMAITIARYHHEKWDGSGYPDRLVGNEIPLPARLASITDVYDALRSHRVYRAALTHQAAVQTLLDSCPGQFDPQLLHAFQRCHHHFEQVHRELPE
jgi:putative two-component system response regulator